MRSFLGGALQLQGISEGLATPTLVPIRSLNLSGHEGDCSRGVSRSGYVRLVDLTDDSQPIRRVDARVRSVAETHPGG